MTRTLLLDLDGTLVHSVPDLAAALNRLMAARGLAAFGEAEVTRMVGDGAAVLVRRAFAARGVAEDRPALAAFVADYTERSAELTRPYPGVMEGLAALRARGWRLAVCTNKPERAARALLAALDMEAFFAAVGGGDTFAVRKPEPGHLLETLAAAGGVATAAVMVGDHRNDIVAARRAGVPSVFAEWGYGTAEMAGGADFVAAGFAEMVALLPAAAG